MAMGRWRCGLGDMGMYAGRVMGMLRVNREGEGVDVGADM